MLLRSRFAIFYFVYAIRLLWFRLVHGDKAEEFLVERCSNPRIAMKILGIPIGKNCRIRNGLTLYNYDRSNLLIGNNVHIGKGVFLDLTNQITIKDNCTLSMGVKLLTHMNVGDSELREKYPSESGAIVLEEGVYLGAQSIVLHPTKTVATKTLLACNSSLDTQTKPSSMYAGNPAQFKKTI